MATRTKKKPKPVENRGRHTKSGSENFNSTDNRRIGKARIAALEAELKIFRERDAVIDEHGGVVTSDRMRKVMGQPRELDKGPTEARLREWLDKDVKGYKGDMERQSADEQSVSALRSELDKLKAKLAAIEKTADVGVDEGSGEADRLIQKILLERKGEL